MQAGVRAVDAPDSKNVAFSRFFIFHSAKLWTQIEKKISVREKSYQRKPTLFFLPSALWSPKQPLFQGISIAKVFPSKRTKFPVNPKTNHGMIALFSVQSEFLPFPHSTSLISCQKVAHLFEGPTFVFLTQVSPPLLAQNVLVVPTNVEKKIVWTCVNLAVYIHDCRFIIRATSKTWSAKQLHAYTYTQTVIASLNVHCMKLHQPIKIHTHEKHMRTSSKCEKHAVRQTYQDNVEGRQHAYFLLMLHHDASPPIKQKSTGRSVHKQHVH